MQQSGLASSRTHVFDEVLLFIVRKDEDIVNAPVRRGPSFIAEVFSRQWTVFGRTTRRSESLASGKASLFI